MEPPQPSAQEQAAADSLVLEEEIDPNYVPSDAEVLEYVKWLGMDLEADKDLFWIAREGLMAPLPNNWKPCKIKGTDDIYYFNFGTGESTWDHPCDEYYKRLYEEEKKKKEISLKENSDTKRAQAKQDIQTLIGKKDKKPKKNKPERVSLGEIKSESALAPVLDRKPLPGLKLSTPLSGLEKDNNSLPEPRSAQGMLSSRNPEDLGTPRLGASLQSDSKLGLPGKMPLESKQSKDLPEPRVTELRTIDDKKPLPTKMAPLQSEVKLEPKLDDSPGSDTPVTQKSQRNFLTFRGLDEESQQKAIAANLRMSTEKKEDIVAPKEDLRPMVTQLEQENAKLLSKFAFHEIELRNCKNELDVMTMTIDRHRAVTEELQRTKTELLAKEEEIFSLKSKLRSVEFEIGSLQDQVKSRELDLQRSNLRFEEEIDIQRAKVKSLETQFSTVKDKLQTTESELAKSKAEAEKNVIVKPLVVDSVATSNAASEQEILQLRKELSSKSMELQRLSTQLVESESAHNAENTKRQLILDEAKVNHQKEVLQLKETIARLDQKVAEQAKSVIITADPSEAVQQILADHDQQLQLAKSDFAKNLTEKDQKISELQTLATKLQADCASITKSKEQSEFQYKNTITELQQSVEGVKGIAAANVTTAEKTIATLQLQLSDKSTECATLSQELSESSDILASIKSKEQDIVATLEKQVRQLKETIGKTELARLEAEAATTNCTLQFDVERLKMAESIHTGQITIKHLEQQLSVLSELNKSASNERRNQQELQFGGEENTRAQKLAEVQEQLREETHKSQMMGLEMDKLQQMLKIKENAITTLSKKDEELLESMARLRSMELQLASTNQAIQSKDSEIFTLHHQVEEMESKISHLKAAALQNNNINSAISAKDREISSLKAELAQVKVNETLNSTTSSTYTSLLASKDDEIKTLTDALRLSRKDIEKQQTEMLTLKSQLHKAAEDLESEKSRARLSEMENQHLNDLMRSSKNAERSQLENKDVENAKLRSKMRELENLIDDKQASAKSTEDEIRRLRQESSDLSSQLSVEKEACAQKEKKIRSYREELLHLQKRVTEKDSTQTQLIVKSSGNGQSVHSQTDIVVDIIKTDSKYVQSINPSLADKEVSALIRHSTHDAGVQSEWKVSVCSVGCQTIGEVDEPLSKFNHNNNNNNNNIDLQEIRSELDRRRVESASLFELIKSYEKKLVQLSDVPLPPQPPQTTIPTMAPQYVEPTKRSLGNRDRVTAENKTIAVTTNRHRDKYEEPIGEDDQDIFSREAEADSSSVDEELQSLSELRNTNRSITTQFSGEKVLDNMSSMFSSLSSAIYDLKLLSIKFRRMVLRDNSTSAVKAIQYRVDGEVLFLKTLTQLLVAGKLFVRDGKLEVERMKAGWKKKEKDVGQQVDKEIINSLTSDLNIIIRFVRLIQASIQSRDEIIKVLRKKPFANVSKQQIPNVLQKLNEKCTLLDTDLEKLSDNIETMIKPLMFDGDDNTGSVDNDFAEDVDNHRRLQPPRHQNFVGKNHPESENMYPPMMNNGDQGINHFQNFQRANVMPVSRTAQFAAGYTIDSHAHLIANGAATMHNYNHRLSELQKQLSNAQSMQIDSLKECDKHVSWLSSLAKGIDNNSRIPGRTLEDYPTISSTKAFPEFEHLLL